MTATPQRPNVWWKPVTQADYPKIQQIGEITTVIRILPGFANGAMHEAVFEKNTATSNYPNSKKWIVPAYIISDALRPENNGRVVVMDISKTLKNKIQGKDTPINYYDVNAGNNFSVVVSLQQSKDGSSFFPNYNKSAYDAQPTQIDGQAVFNQMNELGIADFATWARTLNDAIAKKAAAASGGYGQVAPQATQAPAAYTTGAPVMPQVAPAAPVAPVAPVPAAPVAVAPVAPVAPAAPVAAAPVPQVAPVAPVAPAAPVSGVPWEPAPVAPVSPAAPAPAVENTMQDFDNVFGTPEG
jgi:hypothetical protein